MKQLKTASFRNLPGTSYPSLIIQCLIRLIYVLSFQLFDIANIRGSVNFSSDVDFHSSIGSILIRAAALQNAKAGYLCCICCEMTVSSCADGDNTRREQPHQRMGKRSLAGAVAEE